MSTAFVLVRVLTPQLGVGQVFGNGCRRRHPALADLEGAQLAGLGYELELGSTESEQGRCLGERNKPLVFQNDPLASIRFTYSKDPLAHSGGPRQRRRCRYV